MPKITLVVRDVGKLSPDYSMEFEVPEIPRTGDYISVRRPDIEPWTEDFIVRQVWWQLKDTGEKPYRDENDKPGTVTEIFVEVDQAIGPYAADRWRDRLEQDRLNGREIVEFEVARMQVRQDGK